MIGIAILFFVALYVGLSVAVVKGAGWLARKRGWNPRPWRWGAGLVMYLIVFWDHIPTLVLHQYYCATEAGFWVYKTPEQWAKENPGVLETLKPWPASSIYASSNKKPLNGGEVRQYNDRFGYWYKIASRSRVFPVGSREVGIVDVKTGEYLYRSVDFISGPGGFGVHWGFWLDSGSCGNNERNDPYQKFEIDLKMEEP